MYLGAFGHLAFSFSRGNPECSHPQALVAMAAGGQPQGGGRLGVRLSKARTWDQAGWHFVSCCLPASCSLLPTPWVCPPLCSGCGDGGRAGRQQPPGPEASTATMPMAFMGCDTLCGFCPARGFKLCSLLARVNALLTFSTDFPIFACGASLCSLPRVVA